jgi:osmoprotectant transport system ATP-binding protein
VAQFLGDDRGVRRLSFLPTDGLALSDPPGAYADWQLVSDEDGRPRGWRRDGGDLVPAGRTFTVGRDSLRSALDSAVLNPSGLAVGVDEDGRVLGVTHPDQVIAALRATEEGVEGVPA